MSALSSIFSLADVQKSLDLGLITFVAVTTNSDDCEEAINDSTNFYMKMMKMTK